jgi:tetratricopeptide (TPR) repeat protein
MKVWALLLWGSLTIVFFSVSQSYAQQQPASNSPDNQTASDLSNKFFRQGNLFFDQGNYSQAIPYYDKALGFEPANATILYNKALSLDRLGNTTEAISYYDKVLAINPNDTFTLNNKGLALDSLGKHDEAISYFDRLLAINPNDADALYNKGVALDSLGKHDEAISYFDSVIAINANDTDALYKKGVALDSLGKHDEAMSYYDKVLAIDPSYVDALNKKNLTYNNIDKSAINTVQQSDQTSLVIVVSIIAILIGIFVVGWMKKNQRHKEQEYSQPVSLIKAREDNTIPKTQDDVEWKGI